MSFHKTTSYGKVSVMVERLDLPSTVGTFKVVLSYGKDVIWECEVTGYNYTEVMVDLMATAKRVGEASFSRLPLLLSGDGSVEDLLIQHRLVLGE